MFSRLPNALVTIVFLSSASVSNAQGTAGQTVAPPAPVVTERSIEDLNLLGAAASDPPFTDTILGADSAFRRALVQHGLVLRANVVPRFTVNLLDGPVPEAEQRYIGDRPTFIRGLNPVLTADLSLSAGYQRGAAITPRVDTAVTTTAYLIVYLQGGRQGACSGTTPERMQLTA